MDCKTARLLLCFPPSGADALNGPESASLRDHLAVCPDCDMAYRAETRLDAHVGRVVRDVPLPSGLKERLLSRLAADRADQLRKFVFRTIRTAAVAASVLLLAWSVWYLTRTGPQIDAAAVHLAWNVARPTNPETVENAFQAMGYRYCAPEFVNYAYPCVIGEGELPGYPGRKAPRLIFIGPREHAVLIAVNKSDLLPEAIPEPGYKYRIEVVPSESRWAFLVLYTGDNWHWLQAPIE